MIYYIALMLTNKRGFFIAVTISGIICYTICMFKNRINKWMILRFCCFIILLSVFILPMLNLPVFNRFDSSGRFEIINNLFDDNFLYSPVWGCGTFYYQVIHLQHPHNLYLQTLYENGILGFLLLISIGIAMFVVTLRKVKQQNVYMIWSLFIQCLLGIYALTGYYIGMWNIVIVHLIAFSIPSKYILNKVE